ncbi:hypothetical protein [Pseudaestuariivita rosea]|nr:hypothetical protein [Pseudaestuariivita rosea]
MNMKNLGQRPSAGGREAPAVVLEARLWRDGGGRALPGVSHRAG